MKKLYLLLITILIINIANAQNHTATEHFKEFTADYKFLNKDYKDSLSFYDFGKLWNYTENSLVFGFIGKDYQRIRVKIINVSKAKNNPSKYNIIGKSMVKDNICQFKGTITITSIKVFKQMHYGVDAIYENNKIKKEGILFAKYHFDEDTSLTHSGTFDGTLSTLWYIDSIGQLKYDDINSVSDLYCNNQFAGIWKDYKTHLKMTCNWGDFRIPYSGDLDVGAGDFGINDKYIKNGWENYVKATYGGKDKEAILQARKIEEMEWWK